MLRVALIGTLGAASILLGGCASDNANNSGSSWSSAGVLEREREWTEAAQSNNLPALEGILAPEFRLTFANDPGAPAEVSRSEWLATLGGVPWNAVSMSDQRLTMQGDSRATVRQRMDLDVNQNWASEGAMPHAHYMLTDTWVLRDGRWQVVSQVREPVGR